MKKTVSLLKKTVLLLSMTMLFCSCTGTIINGGKTVKCNGPVTERSMDFTGFTCISIEGAVDIDFVQSDIFKVLVTANEEVFNYLDYSQKDNELVLSTQNHVNINAKEYKVLVQAPVLKSFKVEGAAKFHLDGGYISSESMETEIDGAAKLYINGLQVPAFNIEVNGAGEFTLSDIQVENLDVEVNGAAKGSVSGTADYAKLTVSGAASIDASALQCPNIEKRVEGLAVIK